MSRRSDRWASGVLRFAARQEARPDPATRVLDNTADGTGALGNGYPAQPDRFNAEMFTTPAGDGWTITELLFGAVSGATPPNTLTLSLWATDAVPKPTGLPIISTSRSFDLTTTPTYYSWDLSGAGISLQGGTTYGLSLSGDAVNIGWPEPDPSADPASSVGFVYAERAFTTDSGATWTRPVAPPPSA
jgi:hypothetical protein